MTIVLPLKNRSIQAEIMQQGEFTDKIVPLSSKLLRFACFFLGNEEDGRDVVQDVLLKLWQDRLSLDRIGSLEAYAMQMVRNKCLDHLKSSRVVKHQSLSGAFQAFGEPVDHTEWKDTSQMLMRLAGQLPEIQRSILYLRDMEEREFEEISAITGLNVNAVRVSLSRARRQVREELMKIWEHETRRSSSITAKIF